MQNKIFVVDDDIDILALLHEVLTNEGYIVNLAKNGKDAIQKISQDMPNLVITDLSMPEMNGMEIVTKIRNNSRLHHLPIIMLTDHCDKETVIESLKKGVDDFILKPFKVEEILAKIHSLLFRTYRGIDTNPLSRLPGNNAIKKYIEKKIINNHNFAVCFIDIDNFKAFNDKYGFERGDEAIKLCAQIISDSLKHHKCEDDFIGHIGGDDFVVVTHPERVNLICREIIDQFDSNIRSLYDKNDLSKEYIISKTRQGHTAKFPIMTISIGVVNNEKRKIINSIQVSEIGNELKKFAKQSIKSNFVIDKREIDDISTDIQPIKINSDNIVDFSLSDTEAFHVFNDIKELLKEKNHIAMLFIEFVPKGDSVYKTIEDWENILESTSDFFLKSKQQFIRKDDSISIYNNRKDKIFVFLSPPRRKRKINLEDVEEIIRKIKDFFENNKDIFDNKIAVTFGYSVFNYPFS